MWRNDRTLLSPHTLLISKRENRSVYNVVDILVHTFGHGPVSTLVYIYVHISTHTSIYTTVYSTVHTATYIRAYIWVSICGYVWGWVGTPYHMGSGGWVAPHYY